MVWFLLQSGVCRTEHQSKLSLPPSMLILICCKFGGCQLGFYQLVSVLMQLTMNRFLLLLPLTISWISCSFPNPANAEPTLIERSAVSTSIGQHGLLCQMIAEKIITPEQAEKAVDLIISANLESFKSFSSNDVSLMKKAFNWGWNFAGNQVKGLHSACPLGPSPLFP